MEITRSDCSRSRPFTPSASKETESDGTVRSRFRGRGLGRGMVIRLLAVLCGLTVFPAIELVCVIGGWGEVDINDDPFVGFASIHPLFERSADNSQFHTSPARRGFFEEESFSAVKAENEFRIFVFGGSTVQGSPFSIDTSFARFLQLALHEADPSRKWTVVNCGGISYASYRLLPLMSECVRYQPDLYIVCEGHNEFLEDISYTDIRKTPPAVVSVYSVAGQFRSFRILQSFLQTIRQHSAGSAGQYGTSEKSNADELKPVLSAEVDALLDHTGGLEAYQRDDLHAERVVTHFRSNLIRMVELCKQQRLPVLFIQPPSNLSDCPPFKAEFSSESTADTVRRVGDLMDQAAAVLRDDPERSIELLHQATAADPRFAWSWYQLGHALMAVSRYSEARAAFVKARDEDICPLRMTTPLEQTMQQVVLEFGQDFLNAAELLERNCRGGILGDNVLVDHVHPSFRGHQEIALAIADWMLREQLTVPARSNWKETSQQVFSDHLQSLDNLYFLRGRRRLQDLRGWAAGRSEGPPLIRKSVSSGR